MNPFIGEIRSVGFNFAPQGWTLCQGQLLAIASNTALFSLLGTTFGGDGRTTFGIPDLRGRVIVSPGTGPGLSPYSWGQVGGQEFVTLNIQEMPSHNHYERLGGTGSSPAGSNSLLGNITGTNLIYNPTSSGNTLASNAITNTGGSQAHENRMPFLGIQRILALTGIYPSRS